MFDERGWEGEQRKVEKRRRDPSFNFTESIISRPATL